MEKLYFAFDSDIQHSSNRNEYITIFGKNKSDCIAMFRKLFSDRPGLNSYNAAKIYTQKEWDQIKDIYYKDVEPVTAFITDTVYGCRPNGFEPLWFFDPIQNTIVYLQEGSKDNLKQKELDEGFVDYLDYTICSLDRGTVVEDDGGEFLLPYMVQNHYGCLADAIPDVIDFHYDNTSGKLQILGTEN